MIKIIKNGIVTNTGPDEAWLNYHIQLGTFGEDYTIEYGLSEAELQAQTNQDAQQYLDNSDWMVLRHRDQQELGIATSLTAEEFQDLLQQRQLARTRIV
jgi:hypothetical protein